MVVLMDIMVVVMPDMEDMPQTTTQDTTGEGRADALCIN